MREDIKRSAQELNKIDFIKLPTQNTFQHLKTERTKVSTPKYQRKVL